MLEITNNIVSVSRTSEVSWKKTFNVSVISNVPVYMYKWSYEEYVSFWDINSALDPHNLIVSVETWYIPKNDDLLTDKDWWKRLVKSFELNEPDWEFYNFYQLTIFKEFIK